MKQKHFFCLSLAAIIFSTSLTSCKKEAINDSVIHEKPDLIQADYSGEISQQRVILAKSLTQSFKDNPDMAKQTVVSCNKKFDGDRDVLCKDLFSQQVALTSSSKVNKSGVTTFGTVINEIAAETGSLTNKTNSDFINDLLQNDSLTQIYLFKPENIMDSTSFAGIVIVPDNYKESQKMNLLVINNDGSQSTLRSDEDPTKNYLVISTNERNDWTANDGNIAQLTNKTESVSGLRITRASFTSIQALRSVESWILGEPEVRLNCIFAYLPASPASATFKYATNWRQGGWYNDQTIWNNTLIEFPTWDNVNQSNMRELRWTEEDGKTVETSKDFTYTDPKTGVTTTTTQKIPASDNDALIADSYISYTDPSGLKYWGLIYFEIQHY
jgi:hypothetical protein